MSFSADRHLQQILKKRKRELSFRSLKDTSDFVDFSSNDYLGFARSKKLQSLTQQLLKKNKSSFINGSGGSRLISGNSSFIESLEQEIAEFHKAKAGLIFNSGYDANLGLFSCIATRHDTIIYDELIHASIYDGMRLSLARCFSFKHNDLQHLEQKIKQAQGTVYVAIESVYSMDGDMAPLKEIVSLCKKYNANLIVDEAHATGVIGKNGKGLVNELKLEKNIFARVYTFGKALGCHGAIVLGSELLRDHLINFSRSFIYTTALPVHSLASVKAAYQLIKESSNEQKKMYQHIHLFRSLAPPNKQWLINQTPIQTIIIPGNKKVKQVAAILHKQGLYVKPILSPTVMAGSERLRICLHSFNTKREIKDLIDCIAKHL